MSKWNQIEPNEQPRLFSFIAAAIDTYFCSYEQASFKGKFVGEWLQGKKKVMSQWVKLVGDNNDLQFVDVVELFFMTKANLTAFCA